VPYTHLYCEAIFRLAKLSTLNYLVDNQYYLQRASGLVRFDSVGEVSQERRLVLKAVDQEKYDQMTLSLKNLSSYRGKVNN
jgi:hypothetical protein